MIKVKNIMKVLLMAVFICVCSFDVYAQMNPFSVRNSVSQGTMGKDNMGLNNQSKSNSSSASRPKASTPTVSSNSNTSQDASFCGSDKGVFSELVMTGQRIFNRLRDLIYVVAGFGIIAVAVGGFFGNLNWKWLGAIVISLVVIATAGELIVLLTGCEQYGTSLITNTLEAPAATAKAVD
ncbi:MAG: hypothetical protein IKA30_01485 [Alphaproteobacteria bacterium]|nr:hypothetical protein [Alphaproteobacteria bacterium]